MTKLQPQLILATFLAVVLLKSCLGLERSAQDYLIPLLKTKGLDPSEIKRDALCFEKVFETQFIGESLQDMKNFLDYFRWKVRTGIYQKQPDCPAGRAGRYKGPRLRFVGLTNDDFSKTWKLDSPKIGLDAKSNVLIDICDSLDPFQSEEPEEVQKPISPLRSPTSGNFYSGSGNLDDTFGGVSFSFLSPVMKKEKEKVISIGRDFDRWLQFAQTYTSLYDIPENDAITIYETGMRFGPSKSSQPRSRLFHYMKHFASHLNRYLRSANYTMTHYERTLDEFFAKWEHKTSVIDEELWRIAFKVDLEESIDKGTLKRLFSASRCPPELRKSLENSVGFFTIAMGVAPAEIRKLEGLDFGFAKRIEYLRICNLLDQR